MHRAWPWQNVFGNTFGAYGSGSRGTWRRGRGPLVLCGRVRIALPTRDKVNHTGQLGTGRHLPALPAVPLAGCAGSPPGWSWEASFAVVLLRWDRHLRMRALGRRAQPAATHEYHAGDAAWLHTTMRALRVWLQPTQSAGLSMGMPLVAPQGSQPAHSNTSAPVTRSERARHLVAAAQASVRVIAFPVPVAGAGCPVTAGSEP